MWSVSPYPDTHDFALTIVHDADNAYSRRLAPLFDVFDELRFKLTVTAFAFWADWADRGAIWKKWRAEDPLRAPCCVPLEDRDEIQFYKDLVRRGHEIGLHTASDGHATRAESIRAFEFFKAEFGNYPTTYVEHRESIENHQNEGSYPDSPHFITDLLNYYRPWVWLVAPSAVPYNGRGRYYDLLSSQMPWCGDFSVRAWGTIKAFLKGDGWSRHNGQLFAYMLQGSSPFDEYGRNKFGLAKVFRRSGKRHAAGGEKFLDWYSEKNIRDLDANGGLAIVYNHLDRLWWDPETEAMRAGLRMRLEYIASFNVWKAHASQILDRFQQMSQILFSQDNEWVKITNVSDRHLVGLTLQAEDSRPLFLGTERLIPNGRNKILVGDLPPREMVVLRIGRPSGLTHYCDLQSRNLGRFPLKAEETNSHGNGTTTAIKPTQLPLTS